MQHVAHRHSDEIHQLRAENERLRAALAGMLEPYGALPARPPYFTPDVAKKIAAARAALAGEQGGHDE